jgi:polar amino acid transport system substrate-binding protein
MLLRKTRMLAFASLLLLSAVAAATDLQLLTEENPPLNFSENGQPKGLSVDVVQEIQRRVGNTNTIEIQPWARAYRTASTQANVAIFIMARTPAREDLFQWVGPVSASIASLYGKRGSGLRISSLDDAKAVDRILVVRDFYTHQLLQKLGFNNLELVPKPETMVKMAVNGRAPLMFAANITLPDLLEKAGAKRGDVELLYTITSLQTYIGFSLGTPKEIVTSWQAALDSMKRDGTYASLYAKWLPGETPTKIKPEPNISP